MHMLHKTNYTAYSCEGCNKVITQGISIGLLHLCNGCAMAVGMMVKPTNKRYYLYKLNGDFLCTELSEQAARNTAEDYKKAFRSIEKVIIKTLDEECEWTV